MSDAAELQSLGGARYRLSGRIRHDTAAHLLAQGEQAFAAEPSVQLDLAGLQAADSVSLAVLVEWCLAARRAGRVLRCDGLPPALEVMAGLGGVAGLLRGDPPAA